MGARTDGIEALQARACAVVGGEPVRLTQDDSFFAAPHGGLDLHGFAGKAWAFDDMHVPVPDPARDALTEAPGHAGPASTSTCWL